MAIPRRLIVVAASAATAGILWYVAKRAQDSQKGQRSAIDDANDEKDKVEAEHQKAKEKSNDDGGAAAADGAAPAAAAPAPDGATKELSLFLAGDAWHDEIGWQALWEKDAVTNPEQWLREAGRTVLMSERKKLTDSPALLAGCRRRWIVVCRYAGIDVGDAAALWNDG